jgi:predicted ABC-type ATPase
MVIEPEFELCATSKRTIADYSMAELSSEIDLGNEEALRIFNEIWAKEMLIKKIRHLPGQHDQKTHGSGGGGGGKKARPGMGDIKITNEAAADMIKGSGGAYLQKNAQGEWKFTPERQALHDKIVEDAVTGVPKSDDPTVYMLGGGPATGKSTNRAKGIDGIPKEKSGLAVDVNPDDYKKTLPEYNLTNEIDRAPFTHEESSYLSKRVTSAAMERKQDIVLDAVGDSGTRKIQAKIDTAKSNGYKVKATYLTRPTNIALAGNIARARTEGRLVHPLELKKLHVGVSEAIPKVAKNFDSFNLYDTTNGANLIATGGNGVLNIIDQGAYDSFVAKANEPLL